MTAAVRAVTPTGLRGLEGIMIYVQHTVRGMATYLDDVTKAFEGARGAGAGSPLPLGERSVIDPLQYWASQAQNPASAALVLRDATSLVKDTLRLMEIAGAEGADLATKQAFRAAARASASLHGSGAVPESAALQVALDQAKHAVAALTKLADDGPRAARRAPTGSAHERAAAQMFNDLGAGHARSVPTTARARGTTTATGGGRGDFAPGGPRSSSPADGPLGAWRDGVFTPAAGPTRAAPGTGFQRGNYPFSTHREGLEFVEGVLWKDGARATGSNERIVLEALIRLKSLGGGGVAVPPEVQRKIDTLFGRLTAQQQHIVVTEIARAAA